VVHAAGHRARYRYDSTLDLVEIEGLEGEKFQLSYDAYGRLVRVGRPDGSEERYGYSLAGDLLYSRDPDGAEIHYEYDGVHKLIAIRYPDGRSASIERGGRHFPFRFTKPDGSSFTVRYDREGKAVLVENALGEQHTLERSPDGYIIGEKTFDGRSLKYRYDAGRRLVRFQEGKEHTLLEYDLAGNMIECQYSDGSGARFEYDARDLMVAATTGTVAVRFERDPAGRVVRETQVVAGDTASIDTRYDPWGLRAARVTSANHSLELQRRGGGGARRVTLDERDVVEVEPSQMGLVSTLRLAGGGALGFHHDASGRIVGQEVRSNRPNPPPPNGTPDFPHVPPAPNLVRAFRYDRRASLTTDWDRARGYRFYEYDALGQVTSRTDERGGSTTYSYDSAGNVESAAGRKLTYGPNRRPTQVGDSEQAWDECGRLIVKKGPANSWTFHWAARTQLRRAVRDDGLRVEYLYDALGRRVKRSVLDRTGTVEETRFVWDRETLVHEVSRSRGSAESTTTTYWLTPGSSVPIARRDESKGWCFYLNEPSGAPHRLVNQRGDVVSDVELGVFGEDTKRPMTEKLRFPGQMADEHTGLFYNRFRWYDPLSARYTSPDPLGMLSGLNLYRYAENIPTTWADPTGLLGGAVGFLVLNDGTTIPRDGGLMPSGHPGRSMDGVTIPRNTDTVTDAIPRLAPADRPRHTPGSCVEAHLMSELERENYRPEDIAPGGMVIMDGRTNQIKPPCNYCGPMLEALGVRPDQIRTA
jgi:RHS repeat-associated protein